MKTCPNCGKLNFDSNTNCSACGAELAPPAPETDAASAAPPIPPVNAAPEEPAEPVIATSGEAAESGGATPATTVSGSFFGSMGAKKFVSEPKPPKPEEPAEPVASPSGEAAESGGATPVTTVSGSFFGSMGAKKFVGEPVPPKPEEPVAATSGETAESGAPTPVTTVSGVLVGNMGAKKFVGEPVPPKPEEPADAPFDEEDTPFDRRERRRGSSPRPSRKSRAPLWIALGSVLAVLAIILLVASRSFGSSGAADEPNLDSVRAVAMYYENENGTVPPEQAQAAIDAVYEAALQNPDVISCKKDEYGVFMEVSDGPDFVYCPPIEGTDAGSGSFEIITLQPYDTENHEINLEHGYSFELDAPDKVARALADTDPRWRFSVSSDVNDDAVTMDRILSLSDYQVILWQGHGGYSVFFGYYLCTDIPWSKDLAQRYGLNRSNCFRYLIGTTVGLRPAFFEQKYPDGAFDNAFIYFATCLSGKDKKLAQTFLNKGAAVVFVNSETINRGYNLDMLHLIAESYLVGPDGEVTQAALQELGYENTFNSRANWSVADSLALAQQRYGVEDPNYERKQAHVYYLCRPGMETATYDEWVAGFDTGAPSITAPPENESNEKFDEKFWYFYTGGDVGGVTGQLSILFHKNGTFDARCYDDGVYLSGSYTYRDGSLILLFDPSDTPWRVLRTGESYADWFNQKNLVFEEMASGSFEAKVVEEESGNKNTVIYYINSPSDSSKFFFPDSLPDGEYYGLLTGWPPGGVSGMITVEMLNYEGRNEYSYNYMFSSTGQELVLDAYQARIFLDGAWSNGEVIECGTISEALSTPLWGGSTTLREQCTMQIRFVVKNSVVTEIVFLYAA